MGRTPDFSVRGTMGPAGVESEGRAASFELPSPSLSSKKAPSSRLLDVRDAYGLPDLAGILASSLS